jgi:uncharacterized protein YqjF (DUF2071 family)
MHVEVRATEVRDNNAAALKRLRSRKAEPLFIADWDRALFIHFEVDPLALQREVPFPLDLREGRAYVSLVAFTIRGLRLRFGGPLGAWLFKPIANHEFLNVRTYVRHRGEPGIFFIAEWLANPLSVRLGPKTFGLPYRFGEMNYEHRHETGTLRGKVFDPGARCGLNYRADIPEPRSFESCGEGSLDKFLLERYTAFTAHKRKRFFRIWHEPWRQTRVEVAIENDALLRRNFGWFREAKYVGGNYSPGARDVWMGWPHRIGAERRKRVTFFEMP